MCKGCTRHSCCGNHIILNYSQNVKLYQIGATNIKLYVERTTHHIPGFTIFVFTGSLYIGLSLLLCVIIIGFAGRRRRNACVKIPRPGACDVPLL